MPPYRLSIDSETYKIVPGNPAPKLVCLSFADTNGERGILLRDEAIPFLHEVLDAGIEVVGQNFGFDACVFSVADPTLLPKWFRAYEEGRVRDTQIREKLIALSKGELADDESGARRGQKFDLETMVSRRLGLDISEDKRGSEDGEEPWRLRYAELDGIPLAQWPGKAVQYALDDPYLALRVFEHQAQEVGGDIPDEIPQARASFWLYLMAVRGLRTDPAFVQRLEARYNKEFDAANLVLREAGLLREHKVKGQWRWARVMSSIRERVIAAYGGEENCPRTDKGAISTDRETLTSVGDPQVIEKIRQRFLEQVSLDESNPPSAKAISYQVSDEQMLDREVTYTQYVLNECGARSATEKMLTTFLPLLQVGTQIPLSPRWDVLKATGRTSCARPNLQQLPRKGGVRECFVPRPGYVFAAADYAFIELCTLASTCISRFGYSRLAEAINAGMDPHLEMAAAVMDISYEDVLARYKSGDEEAAAQRQASKAANFGYPGGLGYAKFIEYARATYGVVLSEARSKFLKERWLTRWPEMREHLKWVADRTQLGQTFVLEQPVSKRLRGNAGYCDGANSLFQGLAADGAKCAGWAIAKECLLSDPYFDGSGSTALHGSYLVVFAHDEFIVESPIERAPEAAERLARVMEWGMRQFVPDVRIRAEEVLMSRWSKKAKALRDTNGRLQVWNA